MAEETLIAVKGLTKRFGHLRAVDDISFSVKRGEVLGFLGPNGAGKTTSMRMITGYLVADGGKVEICGFDVSENPIKAQQKIGYLPEGAPLYPDMTPRDLLHFVAAARGMARERTEARIEWVCCCRPQLEQLWEEWSIPSKDSRALQTCLLCFHSCFLQQRLHRF